MDNIEFLDFFTDRQNPIPNLITLDSDIPIELSQNLNGPLKSKSSRENIFNIFQEIVQSNINGSNHILMSRYQSEYGDNGNLSNILVPHFDVESQKIIGKVLISNPQDAVHISKNHITKMNHFKPVVMDSIISTSDNEHWKRQRDNLVNGFSPFSSLYKMIPSMEQRCKLLYQKMVLSTNNFQKEINIHDFLMDETQGQLQTILLGLDDKFEEKYNKVIRNAFNGVGRKGIVRDFSLKVIDEINKKNINTLGPIGKLLKNYIPQTPTENYGNIILLAFAGHDTTGHTLCWLMYELSKNLLVQKKLQTEVDIFWKNKQPNSPINSDDFKKLPFMTRCITETLRLWPAVANGTTRILDKDTYISGGFNEQVLLKSGTVVQINNWSRHRSTELWGHDANSFNPDREFKEDEIWDNKIFASYNPSSNRFSPFSYGPRDCLGKNFAAIEMRLILLYLLKDFTFCLTQDQLLNVSNEINNSINRATLGPKNIRDFRPAPIFIDLSNPSYGMWVNVIKRKPSL